jgi:nicotinate-nucleotide adenylyltransferase
LKIGIFGGTFDPPHIGHLILADEAYQQIGLSVVLWVPVSKPPHKPVSNITDIDYRTKLVSLAIKGNPHFQLSRIDIDRPPPHYAVDTIRLLQDIYPDDKLIYLMGADSLQNLHKWYDPKGFISCCYALGIMNRSGSDIDLTNIEKLVPSIKNKLIFIKTPLIDFSASTIRKKIKNGLAYRYYLQRRVFDVVVRDKIYK